MSNENHNQKVCREDVVFLLLIVSTLVLLSKNQIDLPPLRSSSPCVFFSCPPNRQRNDVNSNRREGGQRRNLQNLARLEGAPRGAPFHTEGESTAGGASVTPADYIALVALYSDGKVAGHNLNHQVILYIEIAPVPLNSTHVHRSY